jgi:hypothetical protein
LHTGKDIEEGARTGEEEETVTVTGRTELESGPWGLVWVSWRRKDKPKETVVEGGGNSYTERFEARLGEETKREKGSHKRDEHRCRLDEWSCSKRVHRSRCREGWFACFVSLTSAGEEASWAMSGEREKEMTER